jgi:hypothetical protein
LAPASSLLCAYVEPLYTDDDCMVPMSVLRFHYEGFNRFDMDGLSYDFGLVKSPLNIRVAD